MFCPSSIVHNSRHLLVTRHERGDYRSGASPLSEVFNPLRYSFTFRPGTPEHFTINRGGRLALLWSNFNWRLWRKHLSATPGNQ